MDVLLREIQRHNTGATSSGKVAEELSATYKGTIKPYRVLGAWPNKGPSCHTREDIMSVGTRSAVDERELFFSTL